jgi:hypothetical protein
VEHAEYKDRSKRSADSSNTRYEICKKRLTRQCIVVGGACENQSVQEHRIFTNVALEGRRRPTASAFDQLGRSASFSKSSSAAST